MKAKLFKLHRAVSLLIAIPVVLWALSGLLHPMMANWMRPEIAHKFVPPRPLQSQGATAVVAEVLHDYQNIQQLRVQHIAGEPYYQVTLLDGTLRFHRASDGALVEEAQEQFLEQQARLYLDDQKSPLLDIRKIESFGSNYSYINRYLPAYRVVLDREDGMQVVVDAKTGKLATFDSPSKRIFQRLFAWFHTWSFLGERDSVLRITTLLFFAVCSLVAGLSGLVTLIVFRLKRKNGGQRKLTWKRRAHRSLGGFTVLFYLMFSASAVYHLLVKYDYDDSSQWQAQQVIAVDDLAFSLAQLEEHLGKKLLGLSLAQIEGQAYLRVVASGENRSSQVIYLHPSTGEQLAGAEERYAIALACEFSGYPAEAVSKVEAIDRFRQDYGFIFKRLPVVRVHFKDREYWHYTVDTANAHMAQRSSVATVAETISFINFHKFHFLDPISKELRDYAAAALMLCILGLVGLGIMQRRQPKKIED